MKSKDPIRDVLLPSQRNAVFEVLKNWKFKGEPLNLADFSIEEIPSKTRPNTIVSTLIHRLSGFYITFDRRHHTPRGSIEGYETKCVIFSPGREDRDEIDYCGSFDRQRSAVAIWLALVNRESVSDPWLTLKNQSEEISRFAENDDNRPFTSEERTVLRDELAKIRAQQIQLTEHVDQGTQFTEELRDHINTRFDHLEQSLDRVGRKDWFSIVVGNVVGLLLGIAVDPSTARRIVSGVITQLTTTLRALPKL